MARSVERLGDKLGPRLAQLWLESGVATRNALAHHEARVRAVATQGLIDRAGHEVASLYRPFVAEALKRDDLHHHTRTFLERASSGTHQWQALAGFAVGGSGVGSVLSTVISNELAPVVYDIVGSNPHLIPDLTSLAGLAARGLIPHAEAVHSGRQLGYHDGWMDQLILAAQSIPDITTLAALVNRGLISNDDAKSWLERAGMPASLHEHLMALRHQFLTPADAALAVLRGFMSHEEGVRIAEVNGLSAGRFDVLLNNTGEPLGLEQLAEALRRGFIDRARFARGLRESRVRDEWLDVAEALRYSPVPTADAVDAALRGHLGWEQAKRIAEQNGVEPSEFGILEANAGSPPGDVQLLEMWRRGIIGEDRVKTGLKFGRLRDEWIVPVLGLKYQRMTAADAADAWLRGHLGQDQAEDIIQEDGLDPRDIPAFMANAGNPLGLEQLLEALRRGFIDREEFIRGFRESRYRNEWAPTALKLGFSPMSTADAVEASIQGWLTKDQAADVAHLNGLEPQYFEPLWLTAGMPLSRTELEQLYNRGLISREVVKQGLRESRLKDKYVADAVELHVRLPEPREVVTALTDGVVTRQLAAELLGDMGYQPDVVAMLIATGEVKSTGPHRQLLVSEISALYADRIISRDKATDMLIFLHFTAESAHLILQLADYTKQRKILDSGIAAVKSHFLAHRIDEATAAGDLHAMNLPPLAADLYLKVWKLDRLAHPKQLTEAQIVKAAKLNLFVPRGQLTEPRWVEANQDAAHARLVQLGYDGADASLLLAGA